MLADDGLCRLACSCGETVRAALMMQDGGTCIPVVNGALEPREDLSRRTGASSGAEGERRVSLRASASTPVSLLLTTTAAFKISIGAIAILTVNLSISSSLSAQLPFQLSTCQFQIPYRRNYSSSD